MHMAMDKCVNTDMLCVCVAVHIHARPCRSGKLRVIGPMSATVRGVASGSVEGSFRVGMV